MAINVMLDGRSVPIETEVFSALLDASVVASKAGVSRARDRGQVRFSELTALAREAEIPYPLFFAPLSVVEEQLRIKTDKLMAGFTRRDFSMNSRQDLHLSDVELIVKDLLRKQQYLRRDASLDRNRLIGCISRPGASVVADAQRLMSQLGLAPHDLLQTANKSKAVDLLIARLDDSQVMVGRSVQNFMPQRIPDRAKFSGLTLKDPRVPYIFLRGGDEGDHLEPSGRKVFTLTLLTVLIACGTFAPVSYDGHTTEETSSREYAITAEILLPAHAMRTEDLTTLTAVEEVAARWKVTPSAVAIRGRRLGLIDRSRFERYMDDLAAQYSQRPAPRMNAPRPANALRNYNGVACSRRMLALLDAGEIGAKEFCRVMFANKLRPHQLDEFRTALR